MLTAVYNSEQNGTINLATDATLVISVREASSSNFDQLTEHPDTFLEWC
jgi:hypothetical protein